MFRLIFFAIILVPLELVSQELDGNNYSILSTIDKIEIRTYDTLLLVGFSNSFGKRSNNFKELAKYIFGANEVAEKIPMTSPVIINLFDNESMFFILPPDYKQKPIPKPNNLAINLAMHVPSKKAVLKYSGYTNSNTEQKKIKQLKEILENNSIKHNNKFQLFVYDSPYKIFNRRNEIAVNLR
tara:strand:+ start:370 stop:918 length:549 start_codon:yes stop_codon:yes gene_type:complete